MGETLKQFYKVSLFLLGCRTGETLKQFHEILNELGDWSRASSSSPTPEALTALRKRARTTKTSVPSPFESVMRAVEGSGLRSLVKEVCTSCGSHDSTVRTWMMFPGTDFFARIPFHGAHSILETDQEHLNFEAKKLQSYVNYKSLLISESGALVDKISPEVLKSLVVLTDKRN